MIIPCPGDLKAMTRNHKMVVPAFKQFLSEAIDFDDTGTKKGLHCLLGGSPFTFVLDSA